MNNFISLLFNLIFICLTVKYGQSLESEDLVGGEFAEAGRYTYHATLLLGMRRCAGAIISVDHVITAARCLVEKNYEFINAPVRVIAGTNVINSTTDAYKVIALVDKFYMPRQFMANTSKWSLADIAVVKLTHSLVFNDRLSPLKLPRTRMAYGKTEAIVTSAGIDETCHDELTADVNSPRFATSNKLRYATAKVYDLADCKSLFPDSDRSHLCAQIIQRSGWQPEGTCIGDAGAPLVAKDNVLIGILAMGTDDCNESFFPSVYSSVSKHKQFVLKALQNNCRWEGIVCHELDNYNI